MGGGPDALSPGDQRARGVRGRGRAGRIGQARGVGGRGRGAGCHARTSLPGEDLSDTAEMSPLPCGVDELRTLFLFEKLTEDQLQWLCERGHVELIQPGLVYTEGSPAI